MNERLAGLLLDVAVILAITVLALAHLIPGPSALALMPYFLVRSRGRTPPGPPAGRQLVAEDVAGGEPTPEPPRLARLRALLRAVLAALVLAAARFFDPLAELPTLVEGGRAAFSTARELLARRRGRGSDPGPGLPARAA